MLVLRFEPKEDITVYELSCIFKLETLMSAERRCLSISGGGVLPSKEYFQTLPETVKRHLIVIENDDI